MDEFRQFGSIISVTTDAILARCMSSPQPPIADNSQIVFSFVLLSQCLQLPPTVATIASYVENYVKLVHGAQQEQEILGK